LRNTVRAFPTLLRVGFADAIAYRAEMLVWVLSTTMPLVMLALWTSVAREAPIGRYGEPQFVAYFLSTFITRQLTGCWVFWEMNFAIRNGTLAMRLLRPIDPLWAYTAEALASLPMRILVSLPVASVALAIVGSRGITHDPVIWAFWAASIAGAWSMTLLVNFIIGSASFFLESSLKLMDVWLVAFFAFSGYLLPIDLYPRVLRGVVAWLPFRFQIGFPVELMTGAHGRREAALLLLHQWAWIAALLGVTRWTWRRGLARFAAYGG
jgi:ABC-2 type transport system permease protein